MIKAPTRKTEIKAKRFIKDYIETGFNGAEAARRNFNIKKSGTKTQEVVLASVMGNEYLNKPYVKQQLAEVLEDDGFNDDDIRSILKRNAQQNKNLPASNSAIDMVLKVRGAYAPDKRAIIYKDLTDKDLDDKLKELTEELKQLSASL